MIIGAFGPYLLPSVGIRMDQILVYLLFLYIILSGKLRLPKENYLLLVFFLLFALFLIPFINAINPIHVLANSLFISQIENYIQPIIIFLIFYSLMPSESHKIEEIYTKGLEIILWMLALNTILSIYIFLNPDTKLIQIFGGSKIIGDFGGYSDVTLAELNLTTGKFAGVFNQTFLVGFSYSLGLLIWGYLYTRRESYSFKNIFFLILILIGGIMSFSKVFIVIGAPMFFVFLGIKRTLLLFISLFFIILTILFYNNTLLEIIADYKAMSYVTRLLYGVSSGNIIDIFTSGRLDSSSSIFQGIVHTLSTNPFFGFGYGSIMTSDLSFYEIISLGGFVGLFLYTLLMLTLMIPVQNLTSLRDKYFYTFFILLTLISSLAGPIFTSNRVSILIWFIIVLSYIRGKKSLHT